MFKEYPYFAQHDANDCGPACLKMVAKFYGNDYSLEKLRQYCYINSGGVSLLGISEGAEKLGFHTLMLKTSYSKLMKDVPLPSILHWNQEHFVVLYERNVKGLFDKKASFKIADPNGAGILDIDEATFTKNWVSDADQKGVLLALYPTETFFDAEADVENKNNSMRSLTSYLKPFKRQFTILLIAMLFGSLVSLVFPFLNQYLIDTGIKLRSKNILLLVLMAQLALFVGSTVIEVIRNVIFLHMSNKMGIQMVSDFLKKMMRLPVKFFDIRSTGDITQRIQDHDKIESFLTGTAITTLFSIFNILVFGGVLLYFNLQVFVVFFVLSICSIGWILLFQKRRREINYKKFQVMRDSQDSVLEIINGIKEIKLNGSEISRRWIWEQNQIKKFRINIRYLSIEQWQRTGFDFINQLKNIIITFLAANLVMNDKLTIGTMLSILYLTGQINNPLSRLIEFFRMYQDARISFARRSDISEIQEEKTQVKAEDQGGDRVEQLNADIKGDITLHNLYFQYSSPKAPYILENINLTIPKNKVTAIVGPSGCGKTTLLKLLLKFYEPRSGVIRIGDEDLQNIDDNVWRPKCGAVMQDGYIFADTISRNIVTDGSAIDAAMMDKAVTIANIKEYINFLPLRYTTKLGMNGNGLSAGQKQRILIARAVYKNPEFLFFDEATSALDARNERVIIDNLNAFFKGKTVVVVAHRLSTVKNADQIIVMNDGMIIETGTHASLVARQGFYYELVRNQLDLGT